ncbi:uncharacterized protein TNCV_1467721 [Trichonephila clavipes]|uniref:Transposase n=1 Tax=Trichonephila clavipes TaxID=2585209 RepID=A0A8X6RZQ0_TRICX|nr:uncharacterized protein TNCV_1467721 [Trichonephila clavipes]
MFVVGNMWPADREFDIPALNETKKKAKIHNKNESRFNLRDHEGRIPVRSHAGERYLPECVIERHSGLTPEVIVWGAISYHGRPNLLRIEDNRNSNRYVRKVLQLKVFPFLQSIRGAIFQQDNVRPHVAKTGRDFCSA